MSALLAFEPQPGFSHREIEPTTVVSTFRRFVASRASPFFETEEHRTNETHERALAGFIWSVKNSQTGIKRSDIFIGPDTEAVDVNVFDFHDSSSRSTPRADALSIQSRKRSSSIAGISLRRNKGIRLSVSRWRRSGSSSARSASFKKSLTIVSVRVTDSKSSSGPVAIRTVSAAATV